MFSKIKKSFCLVFCIVFLFTFNTFVFAEENENLIAISSKEDFNNIRNDLNGNYYLTCDIEFTEADFAPGGAFYNDGKGFVPIGNGKSPFTGTFDGRGHTVSGVKIVVSGAVYAVSTTPLVTTGLYVSKLESAKASDGWTDDYIIDTKPKPTVSPCVGLFGSNSGTITNLTLADCDISASSSNEAIMYLGSIVGLNNGTVSLCATKNVLTGYFNTYVGGVVGYQSSGSISNCYSRDRVFSGLVLGGVCGAVADGFVSNCYSASTNVATFGMVSDNLGEKISGCYYVSDGYLTGIGNFISVSKAGDETQFAGFDFENVWRISGRLNMPVLNGMNLPEGIDAKLGDANHDNQIDLQDVVALAQYVAGWEVDGVEAVANVNRDFDEENLDVIDLTDVVYLAQNVAGWEGVDLVW